MMTALFGERGFSAACARRRSRSARVKPPTLKAPTLRKPRRLTPSRWRAIPRPKKLSMYELLANHSGQVGLIRFRRQGASRSSCQFDASSRRSSIRSRRARSVIASRQAATAASAIPKRFLPKPVDCLLRTCNLAFFKDRHVGVGIGIFHHSYSSERLLCQTARTLPSATCAISKNALGVTEYQAVLASSKRRTSVLRGDAIGPGP